MKTPNGYNFKNFEVEINDEGDITMYSTPEKIGYLKEYPIDGGLDGIIHGNDILLGELKDKIFNNPAIKAIPFIDPKNIILYVPRNTTQGWENSDNQPPEKFRKLTGYAYFKFFKLYDSESKIIAQIKQLDNNWDHYMNRLTQIFDTIVQGENHKINKMFDEYPKIVKIKPEYTQKTFNSTTYEF